MATNTRNVTGVQLTDRGRLHFLT